MGKTPELNAAKRSRVIKNGESLLGLRETRGGRMKGVRQAEDPVTQERR